jgi:shikimate kinase
MTQDVEPAGNPGANGHQPRRGAGKGVVLIGPPTAGKSSVGELLAADLGVSFADTDALVARAARKPVGDIFVDDGELVFRELERGAVASGLDAVKADGGVLALGSGAVLDPDVRRMLAGQVIVYLEAEFATVAKRTGMDRPRVVMPGNRAGSSVPCSRSAAWSTPSSRRSPCPPTTWPRKRWPPTWPSGCAHEYKGQHSGQDRGRRGAAV